MTYSTPKKGPNRLFHNDTLTTNNANKHGYSNELDKFKEQVHITFTNGGSLQEKLASLNMTIQTGRYTENHLKTYTNTINMLMTYISYQEIVEKSSTHDDTPILDFKAMDQDVLKIVFEQYSGTKYEEATQELFGDVEGITSQEALCIEIKTTLDTQESHRRSDYE